MGKQNWMLLLLILTKMIMVYRLVQHAKDFDVGLMLVTPYSEDLEPHSPQEDQNAVNATHSKRRSVWQMKQKHT